jgi:hypothetical protein
MAIKKTKVGKPSSSPTRRTSRLPYDVCGIADVSLHWFALSARALARLQTAMRKPPSHVMQSAYASALSAYVYAIPAFM